MFTNHQEPPLMDGTLGPPAAGEQRSGGLTDLEILRRIGELLHRMDAEPQVRFKWFQYHHPEMYEEVLDVLYRESQSRSRVGRRDVGRRHLGRGPVVNEGVR